MEQEFLAAQAVQETKAAAASAEKVLRRTVRSNFVERTTRINVSQPPSVSHSRPHVQMGGRGTALAAMWRGCGPLIGRGATRDESSCEQAFSSRVTMD